MLYINFSLHNPLADTSKASYKGLGCIHGPVWGHKYYELELIKDSSLLACVELSLSLRGRDHAGLRLNLGFLGFELTFSIYDSRHWDYKNNRWEENKTPPQNNDKK